MDEFCLGLDFDDDSANPDVGWSLAGVVFDAQLWVLHVRVDGRDGCLDMESLTELFMINDLASISGENPCHYTTGA